MSNFDKTQMFSAAAFFSVVVCATAISTATVIRADPASPVQSFIGTMPEAGNDEVQAPTF